MSQVSTSIKGALSEPVVLLPSGLKTWLSAYRLLYGMLLGPSILIGLVLYYCLKLDGLQFASAMAAVLILLLNIYFYVLRKRKEETGLSIWIDLDEIQLLRKGIILYKDSLKDLRVIQTGPWGKSNNTPTTLLIEGKHFPKLFIRSAQFVKIWRPSEKVNYCVASNREWLQLLQALAGCERFV